MIGGFGPTHYLQYRNRGKVSKYFYFFARSCIASFARSIRYAQKYLLTFGRSCAPSFTVDYLQFPSIQPKQCTKVNLRLTMLAEAIHHLVVHSESNIEVDNFGIVCIANSSIEPTRFSCINTYPCTN
jgi:hypothetical protein